MRLLTTLSHPEDVQKISDYLTAQNIENHVDVIPETDWGSSNYGTAHYKVWIIDEDQVERAHEILEEFEKEPTNARYKLKPPPLMELPKQKSSKKNQTLYRMTVYLISICSVLFAWSAMTSPEFQSTSTSQTYAPIYTSPMKQVMLYDFPKAYEILNQLVTQFGVDALEDTKKLPAEGHALLNEFKNTPFWQGFYDEAVSYLTTGSLPPKAPWFEKIKQGELWRLFSPIFLHGDIFHLLFNMAWLFILGRQLEVQLKPFRYLLFIFLTAAVTNTAQYLAGGSNFIGFSGVICAMLTFIWMRQIDAPWEGYQLQRSTFIFMLLFIFGMFALQSVSFLIEVLAHQSLSTFIANTAHIAGLAVGYLLAKIPYFTKPKAA